MVNNHDVESARVYLDNLIEFISSHTKDGILIPMSDSAVVVRNGKRVDALCGCLIYGIGASEFGAISKAFVAAQKEENKQLESRLSIQVAHLTAAVPVGLSLQDAGNFAQYVVIVPREENLA